MVREIINYFILIDFVKMDEFGNLIFIEKGREFIIVNNIFVVKNYICFYCEGRGIVFFEIKDVYEKFKEIVKIRFDVIVEYD